VRLEIIARSAQEAQQRVHQLIAGRNPGVFGLKPGDLPAARLVGIREHAMRVRFSSSYAGFRVTGYPDLECHWLVGPEV